MLDFVANDLIVLLWKCSTGDFWAPVLLQAC